VKYISICSGIEAASTAWHGLGWTPLAFSEIEPFPSAVLAQRYPEVMKDGVVPALTNPGNGGRADAVNVCAFAQNQLGEVRINGEVMGTVNTNQNASGRNTPMVHQAMQVRRLTPTECCRLQGFPDDHCDIVFRKKPAADGPKYRALGNSMAVPCMAWLGYRIRLATGSNNT